MRTGRSDSTELRQISIAFAGIVALVASPILGIGPYEKTATEACMLHCAGEVMSLDGLLYKTDLLSRVVVRVRFVWMITRDLLTLVVR